MTASSGFSASKLEPANCNQLDAMPPSLALSLWFFILLAMLYFDPAKEPRTSLALWVPVAWMFIVASRLPSQWLGGQMETAVQALEEGNALDRAVFASLILLAFIILLSRSFNWGGFFVRNPFLGAFLFFALASIMWSDFPFVALKRWFRDCGGYLVILVVLSDPRPFEAIRTLLRRLSYLLVPLSILLIKYFPQSGRLYDFWSGNIMYVGATTGKNMLGVLCLISGVFFFWDTVARWSQRKERRTRRIIIVNIAFLAMILYLLNLANSATSRVCLVLGCLVIAAAHLGSMKRHPAILKTLIPVTLCVYMILQFGFGINGELAGMVGRNANLTGRTDLWTLLLGMHTNPFLGTGYETFWLGPRLQRVWHAFAVVNEAHNGYLEVYLNLGLIGLLLLGVFLIAKYRAIGRGFSSCYSLASLNLALWTVLLFYNVTEAAFKASHFMWLTFLLGALITPERARGRVTIAQESANAPRFPPIPLEAGSFRR
jgi:exopolysaccharide production protein ExoQ